MYILFILFFYQFASFNGNPKFATTLLESSKVKYECQQMFWCCGIKGIAILAFPYEPALVLKGTGRFSLNE